MGATSKSIGEIAYRRPLRACGIEELAVHQIMANPSGGILFARKDSGDEKRVARQAIIDMLSSEQFPEPISVLTLPGLKWKFEGAVLKSREHEILGSLREGPKRTRFTCIESDRSIYHAAMMRFPGLHIDGNILRVLPGNSFSERAIGSLLIDRFYFGNVDDLMRAPPDMYDVAWLDYTGPLSIKRLEIIANFHRHCIREFLVITSLKARWNLESSRAITKAGGLSAWIRNSVKGALLHDIEYMDGSPMHQIAIARATQGA